MPNLITPPFLLCFPQLATPKAVQEGGSKNYSLVALFTENALQTQAWRGMQSQILEVGKEKFGEAFGKDMIADMRAKDRFCVRDAAEKADKGWSGFEPGRKYVNMKRREDDGKPEVVDPSGNPVLDMSLIYPGVICRAGGNFFAYDNKWGKGISFGLHFVELMRTGTPRLDSRVDAKQSLKNAPDMSDDVKGVLGDLGIDASAASTAGDDII